MRLFPVVTALLLLGGSAGIPPPARAENQAADGPRLLVILVVDQMRADYVTRMTPLWNRGLKRMVTEGAVLERNLYPYLQTVTCAGHATIGTGSFPATHGIIMNAWWRGTRIASCTEDRSVTPVAYEADAEAVGHSARELLVPTLADRLRDRTPGSRVVALSIKPRSAVMLAGRVGAVTWLDDHNVWATSSAYAAAPDPDVQAFITAHPRAALRDRVWDRLVEPSRYSGANAAIGALPPRGWTAEFPHPLAGAPGTDPAQFYTLWENSPYADSYLGEMAADLVARKKLGRGPDVDFLGVSFSSLDYVGHKFGPESHEVQDVLLRLDHTIGDLLDSLDLHVGRGRYLVGLSADHGVAPVPEARAARGEIGGRISLRQIRRAANDAFVAWLGPGEHVARVEYTQLYLSAAAQQRVAEQPDGLGAVIAAIEQVPGIARVLPGAGLEHQRSSPDPMIRAAALSEVPGRSGQLVIVPKPYYIIGAADATTHGTLHEYDQHVPLILFGAGVQPGHYDMPSTPADLAPTLASRIGLAMPGADGVALSRIFEPR